MRKPKTKDQTEWWVKKQVKLILTNTGWSFWMPSASIYGRSGQSDFLAVKKPGLFMAIETKYKDMPTQPQLEFLRMIHDAGHYAFLVDENHINALDAVLHGHYDSSSETFKSLIKWRVTEHDHPPTDQEHRSKAARSITGTFHPAWNESDD